MAGTFSRVHRFIRETVRYTVLNAEFDNIINNMDVNGVGLDDLSGSVGEFGTSADPLTALNVVGTLPTSLLGELQRIRGVLARLKGNLWYQDAGRLLSLNPNDLVSYVPFADSALVDTIQRGAYINAARLSLSDFANSATYLNSSDKKFGHSTLKNGSNISMCLPAYAVGATGAVSLHTKAHAAGECLAYNPLLGLAIYRDSNSFLHAVLVKRSSATVSTKTVVGVTGTTAMTSAFQHVMCNYSFVDSTMDGLSILLDNTLEGTALILASLKVNPGGGGLWFFGVLPQDQFISDEIGAAAFTWTKFSSMGVVPDDGSDGWLMTGTSAQGTVTDGVLNIATAAAAGTLYSLATNIAMNNQTVEAKVRVNSADLGVGGALICDLRDANVNGSGTSSRLCVILTEDGRLSAGSNLTLTNGNLNYGSVHLNTSEYHLIRITSSGAAGALATKIYVDGALVMSFTNADTTVVGADLIQFGVLAANAAYDDANVDFEYYGYHIAAFAPFTYNAATGVYGDLALIRGDSSLGSVSSSTVTALARQLRFNAASTVYGSDPRPGAFRAPSREFAKLTAPTGGAVDGGGTIPSTSFVVLSDGIEPIDLSFIGKGTSNAGTAVLKIARASGAAVHASSFGKLIGSATDVDATIDAQFRCAAGLQEFTLMYDVAGTANDVTGQIMQRKAK